MSGILYIVATPIGNLDDVTLRCIKILSEVDIVLAEDTRVTKKLLDFIFSSNLLSDSTFQNQKPLLLSYHQHSDERKRLEILNYLIEGKNIALVTDAGTPGISDPGNELVSYLVTQYPELKVVPIPGPSALTTALSVCGFDMSKFIFLGFLPKKKVRKQLEWLRQNKIAFVFYDSPFRIHKTLNLLAEYFGESVRIFVGRELTKMYETLYRGSISQVKNKLSQEKVRGEVVVIVSLNS